MEGRESPWFALSSEQVMSDLKTSPNGLSSDEVSELREKHGPNALPAQKPPTWLQLFIDQFKSPLIYVLLGIAFLTFALGENTDGFIISFVLLFNAIIGVVQEGRAQNALLALKKFTATSVVVRRSGKEQMIPADQLVPGDIIRIIEGNKVPADARLLKVESLIVNEAVLTGESVATAKTADVLGDKSLLPTAQTNMVFKGTYAAGGQATAVVVATGQATEIGKIASQLVSIDTEIPLKRKLRILTNILIVAVFVLAGALFGVGLLQGNTPTEMFLVTASLIVAVVPEGLPVVMTLVLAQGVKRMSRRNVLVKRLQAVEALGQAKVIAVDKTGTLTKNELVVQQVFVNDRLISISGIGYDLDGDALYQGKVIDVNDPKFTDLQTLLRMGTVSANAKVFRDDAGVRVAGDPTEAAMLVVGHKLGLHPGQLKEEQALLDEVAFSYKTKYYANLRQAEQGKIMYVTGAPEVLLTRSNKLWAEGSEKPLDNSVKTQYQKMIEDWSQQGLRVIGLAYKNLDQDSISPDDVAELTLVGFFAMKDALRPEVPSALEKARQAGMRVVMITGDHRSTAQAIAAEAGIYRSGDRVLTGSDVQRYSLEDLADQLDGVTVFARVTPDHKLKIINAFALHGEIVAMTGDGVNDVPSLVSADLGVAMGKVGTEVTKEAADLVLLDDNFGNIAEAAEEGRHIFLSIKKVVVYLLSTNAGEMLVVALAIAVGLPIPLLPAQIIWMNLVTDSFLVLPLGLEPRGKSLLNQEFRRQKGILDRHAIIKVATYAIAMTIIGLFVFISMTDMESAKAHSILLTTLVSSQIFIALGVRLKKNILFSRYTFTNKWFIASILGVLVLQWSALQLPFLQRLLDLTPISLGEFGLAVLMGSAILWVEELIKIVRKLVRR